MSIAAIVVTHNRKTQLLECLRAVINQSRPVDSIILVDNGSDYNVTNSIKETLSPSLTAKNIEVLLLADSSNLGAATGFHCGLRLAHLNGHDWYWLLDDDCEPDPSALEILVNSAAGACESIGFVASHVVWKDRSPHKMNMPGLRMYVNGVPFNKYINQGVLVVSSSSFVSVLVSRLAVEKCGLPLRSMIIWGDDVEYTTRLVAAGFIGLYVWRSIVLHNTQNNVNDDILQCTEYSHKHFYGLRNNLYMIRRRQGIIAFVYAVMRALTVNNALLLTRTRGRRLHAVLLNTKAAIASLFFRPTVEYVDGASSCHAYKLSKI